MTRKSFLLYLGAKTLSGHQMYLRSSKVLRSILAPFRRGAGQALTRGGWHGGEPWPRIGSGGLEGGSAARLWGGGPGGNPVAGANFSTVRNRARHAFHSNATAHAAADAWVASAVGAGITPTSGSESTLARFSEWADRCDAESRTDFFGLQAAVMQSTVVDGEGLLHLETSAETAELRLRLIDAARLDASMNRDLAGGGQIVSGIEFSATGERLAYFILKRRLVFHNNPSAGG